MHMKDQDIEAPEKLELTSLIKQAWIFLKITFARKTVYKKGEKYDTFFFFFSICSLFSKRLLLVRYLLYIHTQQAAALTHSLTVVDLLEK